MKHFSLSLLVLVALALALAALAPHHAAAQAPAAKRIPVILDTDIGDDIDDTWALAVLLGTPQVDLKLIVTATDNTPLKTRLVAKILAAVGRTDIPLATGVKQNDKTINQAAWLGDYSLDSYKGKVIEDGVQALIDTIKASPEPVVLCVLGPQTNIAAALARDPSIAAKARVVSMFGSVYIGYGGKKTPGAEYNVKRDPKAAQAVFAAPWKITIAPLDSCGTFRIAGERYARLAASEAPRAKVVIDNYNQWKNRKSHPAGSSSVLYDTIAAYLCLDEKFCAMKTVKLKVDDKGNTPPDEAGRPVSCALSFKNQEAIEKLFEKALTK